MVLVSYALPAATSNKRGGIEVGSGLTITGDVLSVPAASPSGLVQIQQIIVTGSVAANISFTGIPATYSNLMVLWKVRGDTTEQNLNLQFNNDGGANYDWANYVPGTGASGAAQTAMQIGAGVLASTGTAGAFGSGTFYVVDYTNATTMRQVNGVLWRVDATFGSTYPMMHGGNWRNTSAAISILTLVPASGNLAIGSTATLYGLT